MHAISRNLYPLVVAISLTLLAGSMPSSFSKTTHDRSAMQPNQSANPKSLSVMDILSESAVPQTALFKLEDDSMAVHQMAAVAQRSPGTRLSLSDPAATALEAALTAGPEAGESRNRRFQSKTAPGNPPRLS